MCAEKARPGITSIVCLDPKEWYEITYMIPHEGIRHAANSMLDGLKKIRPIKGQLWKLNRWIRYYRVFDPFVHEHHDNEEELFFPLFLERAKDEMPSERMSMDHEQLLELLNLVKFDCEHFEKSFPKGGNIEGSEDTELAEFKDILSDLEKHLSQLIEHMNEHLAEEERIFPPILKKYFTEKEIDALVEQILKRSHPIDMVFGIIADPMPLWSAPGYVESFKKTMPLIPRTLASKVWLPSYQRFKNETLGSLDLDQEPIPLQHCVCSIQ
jgi:iron-sulfur cluster repair protein YtfE (RIC family)